MLKCRMARKNPSKKTDEFDKNDAPEIVKDFDDSRFTLAMDEVVKESEDMRMRYMKRHRDRKFLTLTLGLFMALAGAAGFGWFFLIKFNLLYAALCMLPALGVPLLMHPWSESPVKRYVRDYKAMFMPKMAESLGGFRFHPERGIPRDMIGKTGVIPGHETYKVEDCFTGKYHGVKVTFSEARLINRAATAPVFQGLFVLLETPSDVFTGHTIITADRAMAKRSAGKRWAKLQPVPIQIENKDWDRFVVYSDKPEEAALLVGEKLLKELSEAADVFGKSELTAVLFRKKFIFMMIPNKTDMFEPSSMFIPVPSKLQAMTCRKEIERILEIIDVFEVYKSSAV